MTSPTTSYLRPLVALVALVAAMMGALLIAYNASPSHAAPVCSTTSGTTTCTYSSTGAEDTFVVPQGVSNVDVVATGAPGAVAFNSGENTPAPPGLGAVVSGNLTVTPGQTLYVNVGGAPTGAGTSDCGGPGSVDCIGGFNGGGETGPGGGGGGGASDVRTQPGTVPLAPSDDSRLIVAAGGGGAGIGGNCTPPGSSSDVGGSGGDAGSDGGNGESCGEPPFTAVGGTGGKAGTQTAGGLGGVPGGQSGSLGQGGSGGSLGDLGSGGGGGGGYYGGGGGGGQTETGAFFSGSGGGGGGSNLVPQGGSATLTQDTSVPPSVTISYRTGGVGEPPPPTEQPQSKEDCKKGGWKEFGFKNQGQCIKAVNHPS